MPRAERWPRHDVTYPGGVPDTDGLRYDPIVDGTYRLDRYHVLESAAANIRYHHIRSPDEGDLHDHPWDYVTTLLVGAYAEVTPDGASLYRAPCTLVRAAEDAHRLELPEGPCWTLLVTGPVRRPWGFHTAERGWVPWRHHERAVPQSSRAW